MWFNLHYNIHDIHFHKLPYLSKKLHMGLYHFQHVGCDLIQVLDTPDIHCQQWPLTLMQRRKGMALIVTKSRDLQCRLPIISKLCMTYTETVQTSSHLHIHSRRSRCHQCAVLQETETDHLPKQCFPLVVLERACWCYWPLCSPTASHLKVGQSCHPQSTGCLSRKEHMLGWCPPQTPAARGSTSK